MKIIFLALLVILTLQLKLTAHDQSDPNNPLAYKKFTLVSNIANDTAMNGATFTFAPTVYGFYGCNSWARSYSIMGGFNGISFIQAGDWKSNITRTCANDKDAAIKKFAEKAVYVQWRGTQVYLKDFNQAILFNMTRIQ
jgi:hypothetical protein